MKAMLLAAGRGERLRPITDRLPKALVPVGGKPLLAWHLERLSRAGCRDVVINVSHLGEQIVDTVGDGRRFDLRVTYSREASPLEAPVARGSKAPLAPLLYAAADQQRLTGELFQGLWQDVGTPERLAELETQLATRP